MFGYPPTLTSTNYSSTISSTNVAQLVVAAGSGNANNNQLRQGLQFMNVGASNMGLSWLTASPSIASARTYTIVPNGSFTSPLGYCPGGAIYVVGTSGDAFTCEVW